MEPAFEHSPFYAGKEAREALLLIDVDDALKDTIFCDALALYSGL